MKFKCRIILPKESQWFELEAPSAAEAANDYFFDLHQGLSYITFKQEGGERVYFGRVEVEGHGSWVARVFHSGLWRSGGVKLRKSTTIEDVAKALNWTGDPKELLAKDWDHEEQY